MRTILLNVLLCWSACAGPFFFGQQGVVAAMSGGEAVTPAPLTLSVSSLQYLRADALVEAGGSDGDAVATWADEAGSNDATQATSAVRPTLKTGVYNGHACVRFDSVDDRMTHSSVSSVACWMVIKMNGLNATVSYISGGSGRGFLSDIAVYSAGPGLYDGTNGRWGNSANRVGTSSIVTLLMTSTKVYVNGTEVSGYHTAQTVGTVAVTQLHGRADLPTSYLSGVDIVEIAHFSGTPTADDLLDLQTWAQTTYGTP